MKNKVILPFIFLAACLSFFLVSEKGFADTDPVGFSYQPIFPDNQIDTKLGYYKLKMTPNQEQTAIILLRNTGKEKVKVNVALNSAKTNPLGVLEYSNSKMENDKSLVHDFTKLVTALKFVEIAPGKTEELKLAIKMPKESFDGVVSGGIQLQAEGKQTVDKNGNGSAVVNKYAYIVGMMFQMTDTEVLPDVTFNSVKPDQLNYRNVITINYSNTKAAYLNDMTTEAKIKKAKSETILYKEKKTNMRMAPNSYINFPVNLNGEKMEAGDYVAEIMVTSGDKKWEWTQEFSITKEEADKYNERDVELVQDTGSNNKWLLAAGAGVLTLILVSFIGYKVVGKRSKTTKEK